VTPFYALLIAVAVRDLTAAGLAVRGNLRITIAARPERKPTVTGEKTHDHRP